MTTPTPRSADTVQEDRARTEGPFTFERIPDPPHTDRKIPRRGDRTDRILGRVLWGLCGAMVTLAVIVVILAMIALLSRPVWVVTPASAPALDRALEEANSAPVEWDRATRDGVIPARTPLPDRVDTRWGERVDSAIACAVAGGIYLTSDPAQCSVDIRNVSYFAGPVYPVKQHLDSIAGGYDRSFQELKRDAVAKQYMQEFEDAKNSLDDTKETPARWDLDEVDLARIAKGCTRDGGDWSARMHETSFGWCVVDAGLVNDDTLSNTRAECAAVDGTWDERGGNVPDMKAAGSSVLVVPGTDAAHPTVGTCVLVTR